MNDLSIQLYGIFSNNNIIGLISSATLILLLGIFLGKKRILEVHAADHISNIILSLSIPALSFTAFMSDFNYEILKESINLFIWSFIIHIFFIFITKFFYPKSEPTERKTLEIVSIFGAVTTLGLPIFQVLYGSTGLIYASIFSIAYRIFLYSYGFLVMSDSKLSIKNLKSIFLTPIFLATFIGLLIWTTQNILPKIEINHEYYSILRIDKTAFWIYKPLLYLASVCSPLAWLAAGLKLSELPFIGSLKNIKAWYYTFVKIVLFPITTLILIVLFNKIGVLPLSKLAITILVIAMGTPTASVTVAYAIKFNKSPTLSSNCLLISTISSLLFLPFLLMLINLI